MSHAVTTQVICGATLGLIAAARLFIRGQVLSVSDCLRNLSSLRNVALSKLLFVAGLLAAGILLASNDSAVLERHPDSFPVWRAAAAGGMVGFGSLLAKGCEFRHAVCGCAALSPRSILFVIVALIAGIGSASFFSTTESIQGDSPAWRYDERTIGQASSLFLMSGLTMAVSGFFGQKDGQQTAPQNFALYFGDFGSGVLFAYATALGGLAKPLQMIRALDIWGSQYNSGAYYALAGATVAALPAFISVFKLFSTTESLSGARISILATGIRWKDLIGAALFGIGWGLAGLSPLAALIGLPLATPTVLVFFATLMGTYYAGERS